MVTVYFVDNQELKEDGLMELDDTIITALGNPSSSEKTYADDIHPEIIKRIENILASGVDKETRDKLCKKYLIPKNCMLLDAPKLNTELESLLSDPIKERDKRVEDRQQQLGIALSAVLSVLDNLIRNNENINNIGTLTDVSRLLSDLHYNDTCTRRKLVAVNLDKNLIKSLDAAKRDSFLFGEKFNENVKSANAIKKAAPTILKKSNFIRKIVQPKLLNNQTQSNYYYKNKENFYAPSQSSRAKQGRGGRYQQRNTGRHQQQRLPSGKTYRHKPVRQT